MGTAAARYMTNKNGGVTVLHREYLQDIQPSTSFQVNAFSINPGLPATFPWLSQIAEAYEEYRIRGLVFEFKSLSSEFNISATGQGMGSVIMATNYNVNNPNFQSKREMENYEFCTSGRPTQTFLHAVECSKYVTPVNNLWVRTAVPNDINYDPRLYDLGTFQIATSNNQTEGGATSIGELWVTYEVDLMKPKFRISSALVDHYTIHYDGNNRALTNFGAPMTTATPLTSLPLINNKTPATTGSVYNPGNGAFNIGTMITAMDGTTGNNIQFPPASANKTYLVRIAYTTQAGGQLTAAAEPTLVSVASGMTRINYATINGYNSLTAPSSTASPLANYQFVNETVWTCGSGLDGNPFFIQYTITVPFTVFQGTGIGDIDIFIVEVPIDIIDPFNL